MISSSELKWQKYSDWVNQTSFYHGVDLRGRDEYNYVLGAMNSESGEAFDALKKATRSSDFGAAMINQHMPIILECGDAFWYLTRALHLLGISLEELMLLNALKIWKRFNTNYDYAQEIPENAKSWPFINIQPVDVSKLTQHIVSHTMVASASTFMVTGTSLKP